MPNPADNLTQVQNNFYQSASKRSQKRLDASIERITTLRLVDAIITDLDPDYANAYTVNVYEQGFGVPITRGALKAVALDPKEYYAQWSPCRVALEGDRAWIVGGQHVFGLHITDPPDASFRNRVIGYPATFDGSYDVTTITHKIYINQQFPDLPSSGGIPYSVDGNFLWMKYPRPLQPSGVNPPTLGFVIQSASLPAPSQIYQVLTTIDATLIPVWNFARFY